MTGKTWHIQRQLGCRAYLRTAWFMIELSNKCYWHPGPMRSSVGGWSCWKGCRDLKDKTKAERMQHNNILASKCGLWKGPEKCLHIQTKKKKKMLPKCNITQEGIFTSDILQWITISKCLGGLLPYYYHPCSHWHTALASLSFGCGPHWAPYVLFPPIKKMGHCKIFLQNKNRNPGRFGAVLTVSFDKSFEESWHPLA